MPLIATIQYGPFEGRLRHFLFALAYAVVALFLLGLAADHLRTDTLECVRPPGEVGSCEIRSIAPPLPARRERFAADSVREVKYRDVISSKSSSVIGGGTVLVDASGAETTFGFTTVEHARLNTERVQRFLRGEGGSVLRIEVRHSPWKGALCALFGALVLSFTMALVARGCRDLGVYRIQVRGYPGEQPGTSAGAPSLSGYRVGGRRTPAESSRLLVTRTVLGIPLCAREIAIPIDVTEVGIELGPMPVWLLSKGEAPPKGGRVVLRTAAGAALPVLPELRRGERVHERARIALATAIGLRDS